mgnify:CR=1 FL=1
MSTEERDKAIQLKSWEVTDAAWSAFDAEEYMTNGIQAAYNVGIRDARGQVTPDREAIISALAKRRFGDQVEFFRTENMTPWHILLADVDAILALFNEKGNE